MAQPRTRLLTPIYSTRAAISLFDALRPAEETAEKGDGHHQGGGRADALVFPPETVEAVASTLAQFIRIAQLHGVPPSNTLVLATEAMRRAANARDMLDAISTATGGLHVRILAPPVETLFGAVMGSRAGLAQRDVRCGALFLDLGGGSVQMTWVDAALDQYELLAARAGVSMPYGAARLTRILGKAQQQKPKSSSSSSPSKDPNSSPLPDVVAAELDNLHSLFRSTYDQLCQTFPRLKAIRDAYEAGKTGGEEDEDGKVDVYMCGGGFRGYGSLLMHAENIQTPASPYPFPSVGSFTVDGDSFKRVDDMVRLSTDAPDTPIYGMSRRRRSQLDAIATVVRAFTETVPNIRRVTFCKGSNRDGVLMMKLPRALRESDPLHALADLSPENAAVVHAVIGKLKEALPTTDSSAGRSVAAAPTVLSLGGLAHMFAKDLWPGVSGSVAGASPGLEDAVNASNALHTAVARDPDAPGLTHLARAALGITTAARWGLAVAPSDRALADGLNGILARHHDHAAFWARYIGAVAAVITQLVPVRPGSAEKLTSSLR